MQNNIDNDVEDVPHLSASAADVGRYGNEYGRKIRQYKRHIQYQRVKHERPVVMFDATDPITDQL